MSAQEYVSEVGKKTPVLSGQPSCEFADQVAAVDFDQEFVKTHSIDLKGIIIHMHSSVVRCFAFHSKHHGAAFFHRHRIQIKRQNKHKHEICLHFN